jgi:hypothetical protein
MSAIMHHNYAQSLLALATSGDSSTICVGSSKLAKASLSRIYTMVKNALS